jgi:hypothetical protein
LEDHNLYNGIRERKTKNMYLKKTINPPFLVNIPPWHVSVSTKIPPLLKKERILPLYNLRGMYYYLVIPN